MKQIILCIPKTLTAEESALIKKVEALDDLEITEINDLSKAYSLISILPELDLVIAIVRPESIKELANVEKKLMENQNTVNFIILGNVVSSRSNSIVVTQLDFEAVNKKIEELFKSRSFTIATSELEYVPVKFNFIAENLEKPFPCDFYFRVRHIDGEYQYVKRLSKNTSFTKEEIDKYKTHALENIFISRNEYLDFIKFSKDLILEKIKSTTDVVAVQKMIDYSYHISAESLAMFGISEQSVALLAENISKMESEISKDSALTDFIRFMKSSKHSYAYAHSYLLSLFIAKIAALNHWDSKAVREKICFISFFHDIVLHDDELCKVHGEADFNKLAEDKINIVKNHAQMAATLLEKMPHVPNGVAQIVREHHGMKTGIGFSDAMNVNLQPLSIIFIVVEDFISAFLALANPNASEVLNLLTRLKKKYPTGNYNKAVIAIEGFLHQ